MVELHRYPAGLQLQRPNCPQTIFGKIGGIICTIEFRGVHFQGNTNRNTIDRDCSLAIDEPELEPVPTTD